MIDVLANEAPSGRLSRLGAAGSSFVYGQSAIGLPVEGKGKASHSETAAANLAVSLTMPWQPQSWDWDYGLLPIFEMNLPEGALRAKLESRFTKALGHFDALDLLTITGRHQIGRLQYRGVAPAGIVANEPGEGDSAGFQSVDEILRARRGGGLFDFLMERYAGQSGISGVQPKVLIQDTAKFSAARRFSAARSSGRASVSLSSATHIVKLWEKREYPELAANEYFCLRAAERAGLTVPPFELSDTGETLIIERFDLDVIETARSEQEGVQGRGAYKGFEDFCVLNGCNAQDKYRGSYESKLFRRLTDYISPAAAHVDLSSLFQLFVLNVIVRNGDAHLKNFGLLYDFPLGEVRLSPVYDIVTTTAYLPKDTMALTLGGSTSWPGRAKLMKLGQSLCALSPSQVNAIIERTSQAVAETRSEFQLYFQDCPSPEVGQAMLAAWDAGLESVRS